MGLLHLRCSCCASASITASAGCRSIILHGPLRFTSMWLQCGWNVICVWLGHACCVPALDTGAGGSAPCNAVPRRACVISGGYVVAGVWAPWQPLHPLAVQAECGKARAGAVHVEEAIPVHCAVLQVSTRSTALFCQLWLWFDFCEGQTYAAACCCM